MGLGSPQMENRAYPAQKVCVFAPTMHPNICSAHTWHKQFEAKRPGFLCSEIALISHNCFLYFSCIEEYSTHSDSYPGVCACPCVCVCVCDIRGGCAFGCSIKAAATEGISSSRATELHIAAGWPFRHSTPRLNFSVQEQTVKQPMQPV